MQRGSVSRGGVTPKPSGEFLGCSTALTSNIQQTLSSCKALTAETFTLDNSSAKSSHSELFQCISSSGPTIVL